MDKRMGPKILMTKRRDTVVYSRAAKIVIVALAAVLLMPMTLMRAQSDQELESFYNRRLNQWPVDSMWRKPVSYFGGIKMWAKDRAYPIIKVSKVTNDVLLDVFNSPPQRRVTMGKNGYIFLNGGSDNDVFSIMENACINAHSEATAGKLREAVAIFHRYSRSHDVKFDIVVVPTLPTIYAANLPLSVPRKIRSACMERASNRSPLLTLSQGSEGRFNYPIVAMNAARADEAFFPKANYHAIGKSLVVARDAYLLARQLSPPLNEHLQLGQAPSEIMASYGIARTYPVYSLQNDALQKDAISSAALESLVKDLFDAPQVETNAYAMSGKANREVALMLSDSYGNHAAGVFADAFQRLYHVTTNNMPDEKVPSLLGRIGKKWHIDRVIVLVQEGNTERIVNFARALGAEPDMTIPALAVNDMALDKRHK